jgi:hypothetical protein
MSEGRSRAAQDLLDGVVARCDLEAGTTEAATTLVAAFLLTNLTAHQVGILRHSVAEIDELAAEGRANADDIAAGRSTPERATLTGRLLASVGGLVGGSDGGVVAATMTLIGDLGKLGMSAADMRALSDAMVAEMRVRAGDDYIDTMIARARTKLPILGRYLG